MSRDGHPATIGAIGLAYLLAGLALLLQGLGLPALRWSLMAPLILPVVGSVLVVTGTVGAHRARKPRRTAEAQRAVGILEIRSPL